MPTVVDVSGTRTKTTSTARTVASGASATPKSSASSRGQNGSKTTISTGTDAAARRVAARRDRTRSCRLACRSARRRRSRGRNARRTGDRSARARSSAGRSAPAFRRPISASPSAHSAVGHDEPCEVSTTRTPRAVCRREVEPIARNGRLRARRAASGLAPARDDVGADDTARRDRRRARRGLRRTRASSGLGRGSRAAGCCASPSREKGRIGEVGDGLEPCEIASST